MTAPEYVNHLIHEQSPYLLQHAHNPVDWHPWGKEAFDLAEKEDKPIFLSIGYATCHWCHVMEKESFSDSEIAQLMNKHFVNIKVDREELPEVDAIYMEFAQVLMSSSGGWPLNLILTPQLKPFVAITYLPPKPAQGLISFEQFLKQIVQLWGSEEKQILLEQADKILEMFQQMAHEKGSELPDAELLSACIEVLFELADPLYGGMRSEPKFPLSYQSHLLLEYGKKRGDSRSLFYVELSLDMMARGGIYDALGGGFSRYSVDAKWSLPHFEKMLYDNALLADVYLEAWKFTKKVQFRTVAKEILDYLLREMLHPEGGFYSAQDADSEGQEGKYYAWTLKEIQELFSQEEAERVAHYFGVTAQGNFEGRNILHQASLQPFAERYGLSEGECYAWIAHVKELFLKKRNLREAPFKDDKILTSWNSLAIHALIKAGALFQDPRYIEAAEKTAQLISSRLWKDEVLYHRYRKEDVRFRGNLDDYAFFIKALLSLFEWGRGTHYLSLAMEMTEIVKRAFKSEGGAFFFSDGKEPLLIRKCEFYDGAEPSGNAVHSENLLRLYQLTLNLDYLRQAEDVLKAAREVVEAYPPGGCYHLIALQRYLDVKAPLIIIVLDQNQTLKGEISLLLAEQFCPHASVIWKREDDAQLAQLIPFLKDKTTKEGKTTLYICLQDRCGEPVTVFEEMKKRLLAL